MNNGNMNVNREEKAGLIPFSLPQDGESPEQFQSRMELEAKLRAVLNRTTESIAMCRDSRDKICDGFAATLEGIGLDTLDTLARVRASDAAHTREIDAPLDLGEICFNLYTSQHESNGNTLQALYRNREILLNLQSSHQAVVRMMFPRRTTTPAAAAPTLAAAAVESPRRSPLARLGAMLSPRRNPFRSTRGQN